MTVWFFILGLVAFGCGVSRSLRGALAEPVRPGEVPGKLLVQGVVLMVVGGVVAGECFGQLIL